MRTFGNAADIETKFTFDPATEHFCCCTFSSCRNPVFLGRTIAQAVSRWLPTAAARGRAWGLVKWDLWWTK
jgi:hypothetical protein